MIADRTSEEDRKRAGFDGMYQILATVGHGRSSLVYKARQLNGLTPFFGNQLPAANGFVALKVLTNNARDPEQNLARMKREALAMQAVNHPSVVRISDFVSNPELCYISMEFADRGDLLSELYRRGKPLPVDTALEYIIQVVSGISAIHATGIVHRDIKPENILLSSDGRVKIADFSVAYLPSHNNEVIDETRGSVGTFEYLAPECLCTTGASFDSDLYSAAITLYQLITGSLPFAGISIAESVHNKMSGTRTPLSSFTGRAMLPLERFFNRALAIKPADRFSTPEDFIAALTDLRGSSIKPAYQSSQFKSLTRDTISLTNGITNGKTNRITNGETSPELSVQLSRPESTANGSPQEHHIETRTLHAIEIESTPVTVAERASALTQLGLRYFSNKRRVSIAGVGVTLFLLASLLRLTGSSTAIACSGTETDGFQAEGSESLRSSTAATNLFDPSGRQQNGVLPELF